MRIIKNNKGEAVTLALVAVAAIVGTLFFGQKMNLFDRSADPSNRRTASAISGRDIVEITNTVAASENPVTVKIDRGIEASAEVTDPKLTIGQKIGRFVSGLGTMTLVGYLFAVFILGLSPTFFMAWRKEQYKGTLRNVVGGIRTIEDEEVYKKVTKAISHQQKASGKSRRDERLVDRVKMELH